jgi:hypothetical protein
VDLALEALGAERGGELGEENLEGDGPVVAEVLREVDNGHAAAAELALEGVAVGEGVAEGVRNSDGGSWVNVGDEGKVTWGGGGRQRSWPAASGSKRSQCRR